jgi:hypothetical protein
MKKKEFIEQKFNNNMIIKYKNIEDCIRGNYITIISKENKEIIKKFYKNHKLSYEVIEINN